MLNSKKIKQHFPIFKQHPKLHYLDSAATTQTPQVVLDAMNDYYTNFRANTHRGLYNLSIEASQAFQASRASLASFINAQTEEIIFTSGTTYSLNALAYTLGPRLSHRDNVVLTRMEHHANLVPWQQMAKHYGFELRFIELDPTSYKLQATSYQSLIDANTKIVSFTLASNVLGTVNPAKEIVTLAKKVKATTIVDAAQAVAHLPVDVQDIDCDFLVFSGHKMYGPTGVGVLYGKKIMLEEHIEPFLFGGEMVNEVTFENATWNDVPLRFEAGTQNIAGVIGLGAAVKFIESVGWENIIKHEEELTGYLLQRLQAIGVQIIGPNICHSESPFAGGEESLAHPTNGQRSLVGASLARDDRKGRSVPTRIGVVSFTLPGIHPHDVAEILNQNNVAVRAGHQCAMPLHKYLGLVATVRVSLGIYNTKDDVNALIVGIKKVQKVFK